MWNVNLLQVSKKLGPVSEIYDVEASIDLSTVIFKYLETKSTEIILSVGQRSALKPLPYILLYISLSLLFIKRNVEWLILFAI